MATELDLPKALAELITQLNNLRRLVTIGGKQYKYDPKSKSYKADGKSFSTAQLKGKAREFYKTATTPKAKNRLKIKDKKTFSRAPKQNLVQTPSPTWGVDKNKTKSTPKTTAKKTKSTKTKGVKQKTQYKTTGKPPVEIKPKKLLKQVTKFGKKALKKIRKVPGAGTVGRGVARGAGIAGGIGMGLGLTDNLVDHAREVTNLVQRVRKKPYKTFGATGYEKKLIEKEEATYRGNKLKVKKKTNNKKNESQSSTSGQPKVTFESQYGKTKTKDKKPQPNTEKKSKAQIKWEEKTKNSPARASRAFKDKELWELQKRHRAWKAARKAGKLDEWRKKYKSR